MGKPALGKGLGELMKGQPAARKAPGAASALEASPAGKVTRVDFGRGLNTLVATRPQESTDPAKPRELLPAWFFFAADLLLLAYTVAICLDAGGPLQTAEILFAFASTSLACLLGITGLLKTATAP